VYKYSDYNSYMFRPFLVAIIRLYIPSLSNCCGRYVYIPAVEINLVVFFKFHCFTVHFDSLSFIHTNSCTFSYNA